jgi:hypothetical protein
MKAVVILLVVATVVIGATPGAAQEPTPEPGPEAAERLPDAGTLGNGWSLITTISPDVLSPYGFQMSPDVFREGATAVYGGANGARAIVVVLLLTETRVAVRKSWEDANDLVGTLTNQVREDYQQQEALDTMDPPAGCVEAKRVEGVAEDQFTVGATLCAADPDIVILTVVSGSLDDLSGVPASDQLASDVLAVA